MHSALAVRMNHCVRTATAYSVSKYPCRGVGRPIQLGVCVLKSMRVSGGGLVEWSLRIATTGKKVLKSLQG